MVTTGIILLTIVLVILFTLFWVSLPYSYTDTRNDISRVMTSASIMKSNIRPWTSCSFLRFYAMRARVNRACWITLHSKLKILRKRTSGYSKPSMNRRIFGYVSHINGCEWRHGSKPKFFCILNLTLTLTFTLILTNSWPYTNQSLTVTSKAIDALKHIFRVTSLSKIMKALCLYGRLTQGYTCPTMPDLSLMFVPM